MNEGLFFWYDGKIHPAGNLIIGADNRGLRYGDGCFETIRLFEEKILLKDYHFKRLFGSLQALKFTIPAFINETYLEQQIVLLARKNKHQHSARIRLTVIKGNGGLYDAENYQPHIIIQSWSLNNEVYKLNANGLDIGLYADAKKSYDRFSSIKNNNFLCYTMAAIWVKENKLNDAFILNHQNSITDTTIANIFLIKNNIISTPPLSDGCIAGVMRQYLIHKLNEAGISATEKSITKDDVFEADEVFTTNAIRGIQWVKSFEYKTFYLGKIAEIHRLI